MLEFEGKVAEQARWRSLQLQDIGEERDEEKTHVAGVRLP